MFRETAARKVRMNHQCSGYKSVYIAKTGVVAHKNNFKFKRSFPCRNLLTGRSCEQSICTGSENLNISDTMTVKNQSDAKEAKGNNSNKPPYCRIPDRSSKASAGIHLGEFIPFFVRWKGCFMKPRLMHPAIIASDTYQYEFTDMMIRTGRDSKR